MGTYTYVIHADVSTTLRFLSSVAGERLHKFMRIYSNGPDERPELDADDLAELMNYYDSLAEELLLQDDEKNRKNISVAEDAGAASKENNEQI